MSPDALADVIAQAVHGATVGLCARIAALEARAPVAGPVGPPGPPGAAVVGPAGPAGRDGHDGRDGQPGVAGAPGTKGLDGRDGTDGLAGPAGAKGLDGRHGTDGRDGLGFDDLALVFDDGHGWSLQFAQGDTVKTFPIPVPFDAGVWQPGRVYPAGAGVTLKGAFWIAQQATPARPGDEAAESRAWRLAVKAGRDGKPGKDGTDGAP